jgi:DNA-binding NtrC family response regulator
VRENLAAGARQDLFSYFIDRLTRILISESLDLTKGNRSRAAKILGISRPTLHDKMDKCGVTGADEKE